MNKLIKLSDTHYIVVDDSEIKEDDCYIGWETNYATKAKEKWVIYYKSSGCNGNLHYKITHSTFMLDGVQTIPLSEVEEAIYGYSVENMAEQFVLNKVKMSSQAAGVMVGYIEGFKAHQELVKDKLFTIEDINKAMDCVYNWMIEGSGNLYGRFPRASSLEELKSNFKEDYLQPKTEWDIKFNEKGKLKKYLKNFLTIGAKDIKLILKK